MSTKSIAVDALIERRAPLKRFAAFADLPFVADIELNRNKRRCFWSVPPTDCYAVATGVGRQYGADFVEFLKQGPHLVGSGLLATVIKDMAQHPSGSDTYGYAVGFCSFLEQLLFIAGERGDHYAILEIEAQRQFALKATNGGESA